MTVVHLHLPLLEWTQLELPATSNWLHASWLWDHNRVYLYYGLLIVYTMVYKISLITASYGYGCGYLLLITIFTWYYGKLIPGYLPFSRWFYHREPCPRFDAHPLASPTQRSQHAKGPKQSPEWRCCAWLSCRPWRPNRSPGAGVNHGKLKPN